jgi:hypothetical protein
MAISIAQATMVRMATLYAITSNDPYVILIIVLAKDDNNK